MDRVEFSNNATMYLTTKLLPFVVAYGVDLLQHGNPTLKAIHSTLKFNHHGEDLAKKRKQILRTTKLLMEKSKML